MSEIYKLPKERIELWGQMVAIGLQGRPLSRPSYHHEVQFQGDRMPCIKLLKWPLRSRIAARIACWSDGSVELGGQKQDGFEFGWRHATARPSKPRQYFHVEHPDSRVWSVLLIQKISAVLECISSWYYRCLQK